MGCCRRYSGGQNFSKGFKEKFEAEAKKDKGRIALFSIGVNPQQKTGFGYDDSVEGVVLLGIGHYSNGDRNKTTFQFYGLLDAATVTIDGNTIVEKGKLSHLRILTKSGNLHLLPWGDWLDCTDNLGALKRS